MADAEKIVRFLARPDVQRVFRWMTAKRPGRKSWLMRFFEAYAAGTVRAWDPRFALPYLMTEYIRARTGTPRETIAGRVLGNPATRHGLVATVRSVGHLGLTHPQNFVAPLMVVWNFTQACNLTCKHCYQNAGARAEDELTFEQQKRLVDLLADRNVAMIAFSGGEPLMSPTFLPVARYAADRGIHLTVATNGTLCTAEKVQAMVEAGLRYVEISLDSVDPARHDAFRGPRAWERAVAGIRNVVANPDVKCGVAMTVTRMNLEEMEPMLEWCIGEGVDTFYAFNFIPTGRGRDLVDLDLAPHERERMLAVLQRYLVGGRISIMSSAPQYGRACIELGDPTDPVNTGHYGYGGGTMTRVLARYVGGCGAGRCYMAVQPNGDATPCVFMPIHVGSFRTDSFETIWNHPVMQLLRDRDDRTGHCLTCEYKYHCGGCRARSWGYFRDLREPDPGCKFNEAAWQRLVGDTKTPPAGAAAPAARKRRAASSAVVTENHRATTQG
ncbi:MAG: radical SAM protein [Phycisphaerae bacterium]